MCKTAAEDNWENTEIKGLSIITTQKKVLVEKNYCNFYRFCTGTGNTKIQVD